MLLINSSTVPFVVCCLGLLIPASTFTMLHSAMAGWRLRQAPKPAVLTPQQLFLLRCLRWSLYEPVITSAYALLHLFVLDKAITWWSWNDFFDSAPFPRVLLLGIPMLILLLPLRFIRDPHPQLRTTSIKLLGLGVVRIGLTAATYLYFLPIMIGGLIALSCSLRWIPTCSTGRLPSANAIPPSASASKVS